MLGIGSKQVDDYTLRKFNRGRDIEDWFLGLLPGVVEQQKDVEYRGVVGKIDALVDTTDHDNKLGVIPHEVKSVTNAKYKQLWSRRDADEGHKLQAALYALATNSEYFAIDYIASDDLRVITWIYRTEDYKAEIDQIIDTFQAQLAAKEIPVFTPRYKWQANPLYNAYPNWSELTQDEINHQAQEYPDLWKGK